MPANCGVASTLQVPYQVLPHCGCRSGVIHAVDTCDQNTVLMVLMGREHAGDVHVLCATGLCAAQRHAGVIGAAESSSHSGARRSSAACMWSSARACAGCSLCPALK